MGIIVNQIDYRRGLVNRKMGQLKLYRVKLERENDGKMYKRV